MKNRVLLGIDYGGTKTEIIALDKENGKELYRKRILTVLNDYDKTLENFKALIDEAEVSLGCTGTVGVGIPGIVVPDTGCVKNSGVVKIDGKPFQKDLEKILSREVIVKNDADCFVVSECIDGAGQGVKTVFGAIIGTGCGGALYVNGEIVNGINNITGEWCCNPLPRPRVYVPEIPKNNFDKFEVGQEYPYFTEDEDWNEYPGPICYCGKRGCQELWISGTGFKQDYMRVTGDDISTHDIIANMKRREPKSVAAFERYVDRLARSLSYVINLIDPEIIVLGGGMSNVSELYTQVPEVLKQYVFSDVIHTKIVPPRHGDSSGVRGAAWLWNN